MKYRIIFTTIIVMALSSQLVSAGEITDTYAAGDTLTATKMENIKTAVNGNDGNISVNTTNIGANAVGIGANAGNISTNTGNISTNTGNISTNTTAITTKQTRVLGICATGSSIREINANGTVSCEIDTDTNTTYSAGSGISITGTTISARVGANIAYPTTSTTIVLGSTAVTQVGSVTINAPSAGYVLVTHTGVVNMYSQPNVITLGIGATKTAFTTNASLRFGNLDATNTIREYHPYSVQSLYAVSVSGVHTYYGLAQRDIAVFQSGNVLVIPQSISAIFIPSIYN